MHSISLEAVSKSFAATRALNEINLVVDRGERLVLLGPSGSGKTTLLRIVAGLERPSAGRVWVGGVDALTLSPAERRVAMVFQDYAVYPHLTVAENLRSSLASQRLSPKVADDRRREAIDWFQLNELVERRPSQLSGGQIQRVALAKAVVSRPEILLLDEPLSQLDAPLREQMRELLLSMHERFPTTMVIVTHDAMDAMRLGTSVAILARGRLIQTGAIDSAYRQPKSPIAAELISPLGVNWLELPKDSPALVAMGSVREFNEATGEKVRLGFRPESVQLEAADWNDDRFRGLRLEGVVRAVQSLGFAKLATIEARETRIRAMIDAKAQTTGGKVSVLVDATDLLWFPVDECEVVSMAKRPHGDRE